MDFYAFEEGPDFGGGSVFEGGGGGLVEAGDVVGFEGEVVGGEGGDGLAGYGEGDGEVREWGEVEGDGVGDGDGAGRDGDGGVAVEGEGDGGVGLDGAGGLGFVAAGRATADSSMVRGVAPCSLVRTTRRVEPPRETWTIWRRVVGMVKALWSLARATGAVPQVATQWGWVWAERVAAGRRVAASSRAEVRRTAGTPGWVGER